MTATALINLEKIVDLCTVNLIISPASGSDRVESWINNLPLVLFFFRLKKIGL